MDAESAGETELHTCLYWALCFVIRSILVTWTECAYSKSACILRSSHRLYLQKHLIWQSFTEVNHCKMTVYKLKCFYTSSVSVLFLLHPRLGVTLKRRNNKLTEAEVKAWESVSRIKIQFRDIRCCCYKQALSFIYLIHVTQVRAKPRFLWLLSEPYMVCEVTRSGSLFLAPSLLTLLIFLYKTFCNVW